MEGSVGQEHIPPWTYRDSVAAKRMTAQLVSAPGSILQEGVRGPGRCQEVVRLTSSRGKCYYSWLHPVQEALSWSWGAEVLQHPRISHIQQEFLAHSREMLSSKGKTHKKRCFSGGKEWSTKPSLLQHSYLILWDIDVQSFVGEYKEPALSCFQDKTIQEWISHSFKTSKKPWQQLLSTSYSSFLLRIMEEKQFIDLC